MVLARQVKYFKLCVFAKKALFKRYGVICVSQQCVRPYPMFVSTQASLLG